MLKNFILLLVLQSSFGSFAQKYEYEIVSENSVIGSLTVHVIKGNDNSVFKVKSEIEFPFGVKYVYELKSTFKNNVLINSGLIVYMNGKVHSTTSTIKKGSYYTVKSGGKISKYNGPIKYSESLLYTIEPIGKFSIYSDFLGFDKSIKKLKAHTYEFVNKSNGNESTYMYKNGVLESANIEFGIIRFSINRIVSH